MTAPQPPARVTRATDFYTMGLMFYGIHFYPDFETMHDDEDRLKGPIDCFDTDLNRLVFGVGADGNVTGLWNTGEKVEEEYVQAHLGRMINLRQTFLRQRLRSLGTSVEAADRKKSGMMQEMVIRLDELDNGDLAKRLKLLREPPWYPDPMDPDTGNYLHNCFEHGRCW